MEVRIEVGRRLLDVLLVGLPEGADGVELCRLVQLNGFGGAVAAPIAKQLMQAILPAASKANQ